MYSRIYGPSWVAHLPDDLHQALFDGTSIVLGGKIYQVCPRCHKVVHVNKVLFGDLHVCI